MSVDPSSLPDDSGASYPVPFKGWCEMQLKKFRAEAKGDRTWFLLEFSDADGHRASASLNLFSKPEDAGKQKANEISLGLLSGLWKAAGLTEETRPAPNARAIVTKLNEYEGTLAVDCYCKPDDRDYIVVGKFRKATGAKPQESDIPF